jgi:hypothetical protein
MGVYGEDDAAAGLLFDLLIGVPGSSAPPRAARCG